MPNEYRGEVEVELGDDTYTLRPTINAIAMLEAKGGSVRKLLSKFIRTNEHGDAAENDEWSVTDIVRILQAGFSGQGKDAPKPKDVGELVMATGAYTLLVPCIEFLNNCLSGGKAVQKATDTEDDDDNPMSGAES